MATLVPPPYERGRAGSEPKVADKGGLHFKSAHASKQKAGSGIRTRRNVLNLELTKLNEGVRTAGA